VQLRYFGESKKGGACSVEQARATTASALPLHAGCKVIPTRRRLQVVLSSASLWHGQTHHHVQPAITCRLPSAGDFLVAHDAGGRLRQQRPAGFSKTFALARRTSPLIHGALMQARGPYLENVLSERRPGELDFFDRRAKHYTSERSRHFSSFSPSSGQRARSRHRGPTSLLILQTATRTSTSTRWRSVKNAEAGPRPLHCSRDAWHERRRRRGGQVPARPGSLNPFFRTSHDHHGHRVR